MLKVKKFLIFFLGLLILTAEARGSSVIEKQKKFLTLLPLVAATTTLPVEPNGPITDPNSIKSDSGSISGQVIIKEKFDGGSVTLSENYLNDARMPKTRVVSVIQLPSSGLFTFSNLPAGDYVVEPNYSNASNGPITYSPASGYYYFVIVDKYSWSRKVILSKGQNAKLTFPAEQAKYDTSNQYVYSSNYYSDSPYSPYNTNSTNNPPTYNYSPYSPYNAQTPSYTPYTAPVTNYTPYTAPVTNYTPYTAANPPYSPYNAPAANYTPFENSATPYSPFNYLDK
jgi:hypothetical protein